MTDTEFRTAIKSAIRQHEPTADELRALADDLGALAEQYETQDEIL